MPAAVAITMTALRARQIFERLRESTFMGELSVTERVCGEAIA